jgi:glycosyltransferase involved in cell wall biosynthesis
MDLKKPISICIISNIRSAHIIRWLTILSVRGFNISVISNEPPNEHIPHVNIIECLSKSYRFIVFRYLHELYRAIRIWYILRHLKPDIVHIHSFDYIHPLMIGLVDCFLGGFPNLIVSTWGTDVIGSHGISSSRRGELSKRFLLAKAKEITATTHFLANATSKLAPKSKKVHVIPFGIDCKAFSKSKNHCKPQKDLIRLGFIKHLKNKYGPDYLIKAMPSVLREFPNTLLVLVGQGEMEYELKSLSAHLGLEKHVQFMGYVEYESVPFILQDIDIFVMPSTEDSETFGVAAIEAQAMELPVVATTVGGVPEAVLDGHTGILVEPRNVAQLADAIIKLVANPALRERMGKKGRQFVLDNYRIEDNVLLFEELFEKLLKNTM